MKFSYTKNWEIDFLNKDSKSHKKKNILAVGRGGVVVWLG